MPQNLNTGMTWLCNYEAKPAGPSSHVSGCETLAVEEGDVWQPF